MVTGVWARVGGRAVLGKGNLAFWRVPSRLAETLASRAPSQAPAAGSPTMLQRQGPRDPGPAGRGPVGPPPWWDLSPALAMRLHLLASLSGGGLAWRAGDRRWLAGRAGPGVGGLWGPGGLGGARVSPAGFGAPGGCLGWAGAGEESGAGARRVPGALHLPRPQRGRPACAWSLAVPRASCWGPESSPGVCAAGVGWGGEGDCLFRLLATRLPGGGPLGVWLGPFSHEETEAGAGGVCLAAGGPGLTEEALRGSGCPGPAQDGQLALASARPWVSALLGQAGRRPGGGWNPRGSQPPHRAGGASTCSRLAQLTATASVLVARHSVPSRSPCVRAH